MKYLPGYHEALQALSSMTDDELLEHMTHLFGTHGFSIHDGHDDLMREAVRQTKIDFLDSTAEDYRHSLKILAHHLL
jgi:hypothetical protein